MRCRDDAIGAADDILELTVDGASLERKTSGNGTIVLISLGNTISLHHLAIVIVLEGRVQTRLLRNAFYQ